MSKEKMTITGLALLVSAMGFAEIQQWQVQDYWGTLEVKMTEAVVLDLLGEPREKETVKNCQIWYYQAVPQRADDAAVSRPESGFVRFRMNDSACLLFDWRVPNWTITSPKTERQYLAEQRRREVRLMAEEARRFHEEQRHLRQTQREQVQAEQQAQRQAKIESRQGTAAAASNRVRVNRSTVSDAKSDPQQQSLSEYFIAVGISFFIIAFLIAGMYGFRLFGR
jgi:hypothetical protein